MGIDSKHPDYSASIGDWTQCRDSFDGEKAIKKKGTTYLPPTASHYADGMNSVQDVGYKAYEAYKTRAVFPSYYTDAVEAYLGLMWSKPPTIKVPKVMEALLENATNHKESLEQLLRKINEEQLKVGRVGILADLPKTPDPANPLPYITLYLSEKIINWDEGMATENGQDSLNLVVLDETAQERGSDFSWTTKNRYRVCIIGKVNENEKTGTYRVGVFEGQNTTFNETELLDPMIRGKKLEEIPFAFINSKDNVASPDKPALLPLSELCLTIYRGEADYRQNLYMQGQDTLVKIGVPSDDEATRIGAGAVINVPAGGDAKFIGVSSAGLSEQRQALESDKQLAAHKAGTLIDIKSGQKEAGDTLKVRIAAQTATLNQIALSGAAGLAKVLKIIATWMGANPEEVEVTPNLDFANLEMEGANLVQLMTAKKLGAPLSLESIHQLMVARNLTTKTYEEETDAIEEEAPLPGSGTEEGGNPPDPVTGGTGGKDQ